MIVNVQLTLFLVFLDLFLLSGNVKLVIYLDLAVGFIPFVIKNVRKRSDVVCVI